MLYLRASLFSGAFLNSPHGHPYCTSCGVVIFSKRQLMTRIRNSLAGQIDRLIVTLILAGQMGYLLER